ncbi:TonB-linked SusC/RagA family outer membrane protein [Hydrotalea sandarakina]|jgi:TonB-linked SusC/RagA family outer membrane protein|uniref:TonB-linked SusC/RagA family outer membrane protein n=2 Tax=Hydrotalea sandarakina TaxID=1004304 RepID=A0A2W7RY62_9BACT|nr:TonB-linked SusC/RagA family outer membrane protein [Hydrotalea sandarakina]
MQSVAFNFGKTNCYMKKTKLLSFFCVVMCLLLGNVVHAQTRKISGTVADDKGAMLDGVTVMVKDSKVRTTTNANGVFSINVPNDKHVLVFSYVGLKTQEVNINGKDNIHVVLKPSSSDLNDVVVIGYGTQRKQDVNGAISTVSSKQIADIPQPSVDQMLQGRASGVTVTQNSGQPGAAVSVRIRGITSFSGSEPLYVIDGVAIDGNAPSQASSNDKTLGGLSPSEQEQKPSVLASINPNDIESIDILKDASATAIYGSRGANGVVIITTKKGKYGEAHLNYDAYYGFQEQGKFLKMMNLPQYAKFENTLADLYGLTRRVDFADPSKLGPGTNWQNAIFRRAPLMSHTLSTSGSNGKTDYYISGGYFQQKGTVIGSDFNRYAFHTTINSQVKDWLKMGTSITANQNKANIGLGNSYGIIYNALLQAPDVSVYNADGSFSGPAVVNGIIQGGQNPVQQALSITNYLIRSNIQGRVYGDIKFNKDFTLHSEVNGSFNWGQAKIFRPTYSYGATGSAPAFVNTQAVLLENNNFDHYWSWLEHLNYTHTFGTKHFVQALFGHEVWESAYDGIVASTKGFTAGNAVQTLNLGTQSSNTLDEPKGSTSMESWLLRIIYTFNNKYSITATNRRDQSSNFAPGHQIGFFPGVAASWRLSDEPFMRKASNLFTNVKIRLGYGTTGNSNTNGQYRYGSAITPVVTGLGTGFSFANFSNPNLTWETAIQSNAGIDFSILHNRVDATFDVYKKTSKNFLFQQPLPAFLGGGTAEYSSAAVVQPPWVNAGEIQNTGFEFSITSRNIIKKNFTWTTNVIFSHYNNKVVSLNGFPALIGNVSTGFGPLIPATYTQVGGPIGEFYGYKVLGIIKTQDQLNYLAQHPQNVIGQPQQISSDRSQTNTIYLGDILYDGNDGKGGPNKQYPLGSPNPDFTYSITNNFTYKDFDLSIFLVGSQGGKILNAVSFQTMGMYSLYMNQRADVANFWTPNNPNSNIPAPRSGFGNNNLVMSDRFLEDASYLRIQNVRIGYTLPQQWASKVKMARLKAYISGQNLFVITKYSGLDPEIGSLNQNPILQNIDYGRYPTPRTITFGVNAEF